jgi:hypothetical protein
MLLFTGIGVALGNWLSMIIMAGTMALVCTYRVRVEEQALLAAIGGRPGLWQRGKGSYRTCFRFDRFDGFVRFEPLPVPIRCPTK